MGRDVTTFMELNVAGVFVPEEASPEIQCALHGVCNPNLQPVRGEAEMALTETRHGNVSSKDVLSAFVRYGFQKTSMEDVAKSAGVSRQSLYKKFGSKDACYEWTVNAYLADMYRRIFEALENGDAAPFSTLRKVFDIFIGEGIVLVSQAHGAAFLDDAVKAAHSSDEDWPLRFNARLGDFLLRNNLATSHEASLSTAFVLVTAGKGLMLEASSLENYSEARFREDMSQILRSVIGPSLRAFELT